MPGCDQDIHCSQPGSSVITIVLRLMSSWSVTSAHMAPSTAPADQHLLLSVQLWPNLWWSNLTWPPRVTLDRIRHPGGPHSSATSDNQVNDRWWWSYLKDYIQEKKYGVHFIIVWRRLDTCMPLDPVSYFHEWWYSARGSDDGGVLPRDCTWHGGNHPGEIGVIAPCSTQPQHRPARCRDTCVN